MLLHINHLVARMFRILPKTKKISFGDMAATFFVPINNHYVCNDLLAISRQRREPKLYDWLNGLADGSIFFDVGTSYGQESALASSLQARNVRVFGFDCSLYQGHFCALNRKLNNNRFIFTFAAISDKSGDLITIEANSDTHIAALHKKNVPYEYQVMTLALNDFAKATKVRPTHMKIDVDGAELNVLKGARDILSSDEIREVFIEVDKDNLEVITLMKRHGFAIQWQIEKEQNLNILFIR